MGTAMRIILLEHPREPSPAHYNDIANTPLWACLMMGYAGASLVQAGFEVDIIDASRWTFADTLQYLIAHPADLLAVHAVYFWEGTERLFQLLTELRRRHYEPPICLFGFFPTLAWKDILDQHPAVDYVIVGEPEDTLVDLARGLKAGSVARLSGLALRVQEETTLPGRRPPIGAAGPAAFSSQTVSASRGNPQYFGEPGLLQSLFFLSHPYLEWGKTSWRSRSTENVLAEITELMTHGKTDFYFVDPEFYRSGQSREGKALRLGPRPGGTRNYLRHGIPGERSHPGPHAGPGGCRTHLLAVGHRERWAQYFATTRQAYEYLSE